MKKRDPNALHLVHIHNGTRACQAICNICGTVGPRCSNKNPDKAVAAAHMDRNN
jgi:hypothetical protein